MADEVLENTEGETLDTAALAATISEDLFGQDTPVVDGDEVPLVEGEEKPTEPAPEAAAPPQTSENSEEVQALGAPDTWTKEALAKWATIDPEVQAEIVKREDDMKKGLADYKPRAEFGDRMQAVFQPYQPLIEAQNVDPAEVTAGLLSNHVMLLDKRVSAEQKAGVISRLIDFYQIDLPAVMKLRDIEAAIPPEVKAMQERINQLETGLTQREQADYQSRFEATSKAVEAFKSSKDPSGNPLYPHYDLVAADMAALMKSGIVSRDPSQLPAAYEKAVAMNPELRQLEVDRLISERTAAATKAELERVAAANKARGINVNTTPTDRNGAVPKGSWEDTLAETAASIAARA